MGGKLSNHSFEYLLETIIKDEISTSVNNLKKVKNIQLINI